MIWLLLGVVLLAASRGLGPARPDVLPSTEWRSAEIEAGACAALDSDRRPSADELQWLLAKGVYPEHSWPMSPGAPLPPNSAREKRQLWSQLLTFARGVLDDGIDCGGST